MPKIIGSSLEEHRTEMHRRIFDALSELLGACGYDSVGLADVAKRAGIGRTAMYNYYPDKESLILAFAAAETERFLGELEATLKSASTPIDQLRAYLAALIHEIAAQPFSTTAMSQVMSEEGRQAMRGTACARSWKTRSPIVTCRPVMCSCDCSWSSVPPTAGSQPVWPVPNSRERSA